MVNLNIVGSYQKCWTWFKRSNTTTQWNAWLPSVLSKNSKACSSFSIPSSVQHIFKCFFLMCVSIWLSNELSQSGIFWLYKACDILSSIEKSITRSLQELSYIICVWVGGLWVPCSHAESAGWVPLQTDIWKSWGTAIAGVGPAVQVTPTHVQCSQWVPTPASAPQPAAITKLTTGDRAWLAGGGVHDFL